MEKEKRYQTYKNILKDYSDYHHKLIFSKDSFALDYLKKQKPKEFSETLALSISGQMHGATLLDKEAKVGPLQYVEGGLWVLGARMGRNRETLLTIGRLFTMSGSLCHAQL